MLSLLAAAILASQSSTLNRDSFGVPHIRAANLSAAFELAGKAAAEDRLWQMENSRRLARGSMAEVFGSSFAAGDREVLTTGYTDAELRQQFDRMSADSKTMFTAYAKGVNAAIAEAKTAGRLPKGYSENGFDPQPWTELDSVAIAIRLYQMFGQGGAGEIRNFALLLYLQGRPNKEVALSVFDDFLWENDPKSPTTVLPGDDPLRTSPPSFHPRSRKTLESHIALLPKVSILDLVRGIRFALREESTRIAEARSVPYKVGSYAVVVGPQRSGSGNPLLLSAPQMGHTTPAMIHEMSIECPEYAAVGMDVPGVPGIAIGHTKSSAWGLTSGVADTTDIYFAQVREDGSLQFGSGSVPLTIEKRTLRIKGREPETVESKRAPWGPVILSAAGGKTLFVQRSSWWMREMESYEAMRQMGSAKNLAEVESALRTATVSFNCFFALTDGTIGYRYVGRIPIRAPGFDPRLPLPYAPEADWKGALPYEQMPHVVNPRSGQIDNWNNKPAVWWPNSDTPVWGRNFRVEALRAALPARPKLTMADVERAAWTIARTDSTYAQLFPFLVPALDASIRALENPAPNVRVSGVYLEALRQLRGFDGWNLEGSVGAYVYAEFVRALREELFLETTGNFLSDATFRTVAQSSVILEALEGRTKVDYRRGRTLEAVVRAALDRMAPRLGEPENWRYAAGKIPIPGEAPIPYSDRGSYLQFVELGRLGVRGRNVVSPGVAEEGPHSRDQAPLARSWTFKPMGW